MAAWRFEGGDIFAAFDEEEQNFVRFSCRFEVVEKRVDILTGNEEIVVRIQNGYSNPLVKLPRVAISEDTIVDELTKYGVSLPNEKCVKGLVKEILIDTEEVAPKILEFKKLGFVYIKGTEYFLADRLYAANHSGLDGAVCAALEMKPKGTLRQYRQFLVKEVAKSPKLAMAFVLGVTAPVAHILKKDGVFYETLLWSFCGETSSGKTTTILGMLSLFGNCQYLLGNLNATSNALATQISAQSGYPFAADEATRSKIDFDELIYSLSSGKGKRRCNGDGTLKELVNFSGAAFFSSEQPILDKCSEQGGEEARVVEFEFNWFDGDGKKAKRFLRFFNTHYGVATAPLASLLLDTKIQRKIVSHFLRAQEKLKKRVTVKDGVDDRIVQRFAIIAVACWVLQKAVKVDFHMPYIIDLLVKVFEDKQTRICRTDSTERLVQLFVEDFIHSQEKYNRTGGEIKKSQRHASFYSHHIPGSLRGEVNRFKGRECLWLPSDVFDEILNRQSTYGAGTAKKKLHEAGYLEKFGNAYYKWHNFGASSCKAYCVYLPQNAEPIREDEVIEVDRSLKIESKPMLIAGFVGLTSQHVAMIMNEELAEKVGAKNEKTLFLHTWGSKEFLLLTSKPSETAIPLHFQKDGTSYVATDDRLTAVLQASKLAVNRRERLLLNDIKIQDGTQIAMIYVDNPFGQTHEGVDDRFPYRIPCACTHKHAINIQNLRSLLED